MTRILPLVVALALTTAPALANGDPQIAGTEWILLAIDGTSVTSPATLTLGDDGQVSGQAPCNRYFGTNTATLPALALEAIGATRMACPELDAEADYLTALQGVTAAEVQEGHLILTGADGRKIEFYRADTEDAPLCLSCPKAE
ncbi:META domain-containing protein [Rhodobacter sp. Har01]|uniref:META domain-containing protein n=1 Tax=Rhodobacter sp. Har01 TaxID=2883999 RepID=UPI001D07F958|nr:META domain-containing protein [Rhodobacter sp. Har01]MCB6178723.1 META domain-containing protein [Rhodobacter sp. Har01]